MARITRHIHPDIDQYRKAFEVCETRWRFMSCLNRTDRFQQFQNLGVELVQATNDDGTVVGVCFVLPGKIVVNSSNVDAVWLFDFAVRPEAEGVGAMMLLKIMGWYPTALAIGATQQTAALCRALKWSRRDSVWRCVHPIRWRKLVEDYAGRLSPGKIRLMRVLGFLYTPLTCLLMFSLGTSWRGKLSKPEGRSPAGRVAALAGDATGQPQDFFEVNWPWIDVITVRARQETLQTVVRASIARVVRDTYCGLARLRAHLAAWRELYRDNVTLVEMLVTSKREKRRALLCGYLAVPMPLYVWDKAKRVSPEAAELDLSNFSFGSTDKVL